MTAGKLYLCPTPLDHGSGESVDLRGALPEETLRVEARISHWICENAKSARAFLKRVDALYPLAVALQQQSIVQLPHSVAKKGDHRAGEFDSRPLLESALAGADMGLMSEAGMPAVADPGSSVVRAAHDLGIAVVPLIGPCSILLALCASGLSGQRFAFVGYLPVGSEARSARIKELETLALRSESAQLCIETPYRNAALLECLLLHLKSTTRLALSCGLTLEGGWSQSMSVAHWRCIAQEASRISDSGEGERAPPSAKEHVAPPNRAISSAMPPAMSPAERIARIHAYPCIFAIGG